MEITSAQFALFTALIFAIYYFVSGKTQNLILLVASYVFLLSWHTQFAFVFLVLTCVNFIVGQNLEKKQKKAKYVLYIGILINIVALGFFKYSDFFIPSALHLLQSSGFASAEGGLQILLPLGLSFFVVRAISYLIDVHRGLTKPSTDFIEFSLYMVYFPYIVSGPIERFRGFSPALHHKRIFNKDQMNDGLVLILQGLVRKLVIANLLFMLLPLDIFSRPKGYSSPELTLWLFVYTFALYNDFAGYTAIARGVSSLFGIPLSPNFNIPYLAHNFSEFWQRWHITLSAWLRDYIFMPVTRTLLRHEFSRTHPFSIILPSIVTMFVSALWHNVSWNMLVWGGMHGLYLVVERVLVLSRPVKPSDEFPNWRKVPSVMLVFGLTMLAWVPFRTDLPSTLDYWVTLFSPSNWQSAMNNVAVLRQQLLNRYTLDVMVLATLSLGLDFAHFRFGEQAFQRCPIFVQALLLNFAAFALYIASIIQNQPPAFVYQGF